MPPEAATTTAPGAGPGGGHLRALDGLRGVAVLAVLAFHSGATRAVGGWVGVDVFFVLSGFLITWLLLGEHRAAGRVRLRAFYARRALRLAPALVLLVVAVVLYALLAPHPVATQGLTSGVVGTLLYVSDLQAATGHVPVLGLVEHTWSLSIEEHFYLLWPPLLLLLLRRAPRAALPVTLLLAAVSAALAPLLWAGDRSVARLYYGPDVRAQALLLGCALALLCARRPLPATGPPGTALRAAGALSAAGLVVVAVALHYRSPSVFHGGLTLAALLATVLVASLVAGAAAPLAALLTSGALVAVGRISYGLYLWHWPVFLALNEDALGLPWLPTQAVRLVVAVAAAATSYLVVERRLLALRHRFDPPRRAPVLAGPS